MKESATKAKRGIGYDGRTGELVECYSVSSEADPTSPQALRELIAQWRKQAEVDDDPHAAAAFGICADQLEAAFPARAGDRTQE